MAVNWRSRVQYVFESGQLVWSVDWQGPFVSASVDWYAHWADTQPPARHWYASPTSDPPAETCLFLQADNPALALRWIAVPAHGLFPLEPGTNPVFGPGVPCAVK